MCLISLKIVAAIKFTSSLTVQLFLRIWGASGESTVSGPILMVTQMECFRNFIVLKPSSVFYCVISSFYSELLLLSLFIVLFYFECYSKYVFFFYCQIKTKTYKRQYQSVSKYYILLIKIIQYIFFIIFSNNKYLLGLFMSYGLFMLQSKMLLCYQYDKLKTKICTYR